MKVADKYKAAKLPPADLVLALINGEPKAVEQVIEFYRDYITACARSAINSHSIGRQDIFDEQEMIQEMDLHLVKANFSLRKKMQENVFYKQPVVVIVSPK